MTVGILLLNTIAIPIIVFIASFLLKGSAGNIAIERYPEGHPRCPCLHAASDRIKDNYTTTNQIGVNFTTFGLGYCAPHDAVLQSCLMPCTNEDDEDADNIFSHVTQFCDRSYCNRNYCYVDPNDCDLLHAKSTIYFDRHYSYATCGAADIFTGTHRLEELAGQTLNVALLRNSGGWRGAYSASGEHHEGPWSQWTGVIVDFLKEAAKEGGFNLRSVTPPDYLQQETLESLGSSNSFAQCVHSAALGYLDMCIASFTINTDRALAADFVQMGVNEVYMIVNTDDTEGTNDFLGNVSKVFAPFLVETWLFILFFVIPILGMLTLFHECGNEAFPKASDQVTDQQTPSDQKKSNILLSLWSYVPDTLYNTLLATLRGDYDVPVTTIGGKFNVLAIMFFIANLASFFTLQGGRKGIDTLDDAILAGWRFCIVRSHLEQAKTKFPQLKDSFFVIDPVELGGDGLPGFACDNCDARTRVLQQVDPVKAKRDDSYCHAALTHLTNLEKAQEVGDHCNLKGVDELFGTLWGFPVSAKYSREVTSLVLKLQNEGRFHKILETNRPSSRCKLSDSNNSELSAISISDLTGIWVVTFGFATIGILFTLLGKGTGTIQHYRKNKMMTSETNQQQSTKTKVDATKDEHATEIFGLNTFENTDLTGTEVSMRP